MVRNKYIEIKEKINLDKIPGHVAIIMDGNGRWAEKRGNQRIFGHKNSVEAVRDTVEASAELGIEYLTLYAFSKENWERPKDEVDALMSLLVSTLHAETKTLLDNNVRLLCIGDLQSLPESVYKQLEKTIMATENNTGLKLIVALSYSARWEIINAVKNISQQIKSGTLNIENITADVFGEYLSTAGIPDPELLIRTSGECRISNFLLWQIAYTEFYFIPVFWPDFRRNNLYEAILDYQNRERRFGKVSAQLEPGTHK